MKIHLSISPTIYEKLFPPYYFANKLQSKTVISENLRKALMYKKAAHKVLVKLTPWHSLTKLSFEMFPAQKVVKSGG